MKDHPKLRRCIETHGLKPHILAKKGKWYTDGSSAVTPEGEIIWLVGGNFPKQLHQMSKNGEFGPEAASAKKDSSEYWNIRDALITWPDSKKIKKDGLKELFPSSKGALATKLG